MIIKSQPLFLLLALAALLPSCSSVKLNPFGSDSAELSRIPANSTEYICDGNKRFYVRMLNNGNDAWLIYPDHDSHHKTVAQHPLNCKFCGSAHLVLSPTMHDHSCADCGKLQNDIPQGYSTGRSSDY